MSGNTHWPSTCFTAQLHDYNILSSEELALRGYRGSARDPAELRAANVTKGTLARIWRFLSPHRGRLAAYLVALMASAAIGSVPPLLVKAFVDTITNGHQHSTHDNLVHVDVLAAAMVALALATTALALLNRWLGAVIGEGITYDLRVRLYDHVQRMPVAFFTRTQTGSLMSRLTTDVLDAQNAVGTAASVVSDVMTLVFVLVPMFVLSPLVTGVALLVLPPFLFLDRVMARRISRLSRHRMQLNADMSSNMTERFNVSGALLVKLFGRPDAEAREFSGRAGRVRDSGIRLALLSRYLFASLSLVGAVGTAAVYWLGGREAVLGAAERGHGRGPGGLRDEAVLAADRSGQRPNRCAGGDREFRPGVRGARRGPDGCRQSRFPAFARPGRRAGRGERGVVPLPGRLRGVGGVAGGHGGDRRVTRSRPSRGIGS